MKHGCVAWLAVMACAGCYLHHGPPSPGVIGDATVDAGLDAPIDAAVDASIDAAVDAPTDAGMCEIVTLTPEPIEAPVDIVWAIDSSMSMQDERDRLQVAINDFARRIRARVDDLHVVVVTLTNIVPAPLGTDPERFMFVPREVPSKDALTILISSFPDYATFLRPEALLHLVVVSDDNSTLSAERFTSNANTLFAKPYTLHAIASPDVDGGPCRSAVPSPLCLATGIQAVCGAAEIGAEYYRAAELTGGLTIDVCEDDWSRVLGPLSDAVVGAEPIPCRSLAPIHGDGVWPTSVGASLRVSGLTPRAITQVGSALECGQTLSFYLDPYGWEMGSDFVLCPTTCTEIAQSGGSVDIELDCVTTPLRQP